MDIPGPVELIIIAGVIIVLFGSKKLPDAARSFGRSLRIFKAETRGLHDDVETPPTQQQGISDPPQLVQAPAPQPLPPVTQPSAEAAPAPSAQPAQTGERPTQP